MLSVIMGAYNIDMLGEKFDQAITSILEQTFTDFELVICDDGSTDNTYARIESLKSKYAQLKLIRNDKNMGLAATLNHCLTHCSGQYIARHDADDFSAPDRFKEQIEYLQLHKNISFVGCNVLMVDDNGVWGRRVFLEYPKKEDFLFTQPFVHGAIMFKRECLEKNAGYRVAKETRRCEDYDLLMRLYANGCVGANLQQYLYSFREDLNTLFRRKYRYRIDESIVRWRGFKALGLLPWATPYVIKPLIVGLLPSSVAMKLKKKQYQI